CSRRIFIARKPWQRRPDAWKATSCWRDPGRRGLSSGLYSRVSPSPFYLSALRLISNEPTLTVCWSQMAVRSSLPLRRYGLFRPFMT
ncbi:probable secretion protein, partial [Methylomonas albis]